MRHLIDLGRKIRTLRRKRGFSQAALGQRLRVSQKEISHYETNYRTPPAEMIPLLAEALGTTAGELYGEPVTPHNDAVLQKPTVWLIAEKLELLDELQRREILAAVERIINEKDARKVAEEKQ